MTTTINSRLKKISLLGIANLTESREGQTPKGKYDLTNYITAFEYEYSVFKFEINIYQTTLNILIDGTPSKYELPKALTRKRDLIRYIFEYMQEWRKELDQMQNEINDYED